MGTQLEPPPARRPIDQKNPLEHRSRRWSPWLWLVLTAAVFVTLIFAQPRATETNKLDYAKFRARVAVGVVVVVEIHQSSGKIEGLLSTGESFTAQGPPGGIPDAD